MANGSATIQHPGQRSPGRPRHTGQSVSGARTAREEILDHAARLFVEHSFSGTSTREIAEACGIRQASLYYHFTGKDDILAELLTLTVRPSLDRVDEIEQMAAGSPAAALYLLAMFDTRTLALAPHNSGLLYGLPDVRTSDAFSEFRPALQRLNEAYGRLAVEVASDAVAATTSATQLGGLIMQMVESVIRTRAGGQTIGPAETHAVAASCLRLCGVHDEQITTAATAAERALPDLVTACAW